MRAVSLIADSSTDQGGGKRWGVTAAYRPVWPGPADTGPSRKNRTHNNRRVLPLDEHRILCSRRKSGRRSTASVLSRMSAVRAGDDGHEDHATGQSAAPIFFGLALYCWHF